jgi:hypothetical protein
MDENVLTMWITSTLESDAVVYIWVGVITHIDDIAEHLPGFHPIRARVGLHVERTRSTKGMCVRVVVSYRKGIGVDSCDSRAARP